MTVPATAVPVSGERFSATYELRGDPTDARARAEAISVEQTIEFPADLIGLGDIRKHVMGHVERLEVLGPDRARVAISYAVEITGFQLPQLLSVAYGNCSLLRGVRLVGLDLPDTLLRRFAGPRFGVDGLRQRLGAGGRPLLATALKPMGLDAEALAAMAATLARGGIDLIKDDQGLADQPWATFHDRLSRCADAVRAANEETGGQALYLPALNCPAETLLERAHAAREAGVGGLLVLPGLHGMDAVRSLAEDETLGLPIMAHPSFLGAFVADEAVGISPGLLFGTLLRVAGADLSVFPSYGGRFSAFDTPICREIVDACAAPLGDLASSMPAPGGGMTVARIDELLSFYGRDVALLIGGDLHRGDLYDNARRMREAVESHSRASAGP